MKTKISLLGISLLLVGTLSGCVSIAQNPAPSIAPTTTLSLTDSVDLTTLPTWSTKPILPKGWFGGENIETDDGVISEGYLTESYIQVFSEDKSCSMEASIFLTDTTNAEHGDFFNSKTNLYSFDTTGDMNNENTVELKTSLANTTLQLATGDYTTVTVDTPVLDTENSEQTIANPEAGTTQSKRTAIRVISDEVSTVEGEAASGFPTINVTYTCNGTIDEDTWTSLINGLTINLDAKIETPKE